MKNLIFAGLAVSLAVALFGAALFVFAQTYGSTASQNTTSLSTMSQSSASQGNAPSPTTQSLWDQLSEVIISTQNLIATIQNTRDSDYLNVQLELSSLQDQLANIAKGPFATPAERQGAAAALLTISQNLQGVQLRLNALQQEYSAINSILGNITTELANIRATIQTIQ